MLRWCYCTVLASLLLLTCLMLMAWPLELLLFLAVADKPEGVGTVSGIVVFVLPTAYMNLFSSSTVYDS